MSVICHTCCFYASKKLGARFVSRSNRSPLDGTGSDDWAAGRVRRTRGRWGSGQGGSGRGGGGGWGEPVDQKAGRGGGSLVVFYLTVIYSVMLIFGGYDKQSFFLRVNLDYFQFFSSFWLGGSHASCFDILLWVCFVIDQLMLQTQFNCQLRQGSPMLVWQSYST